MAALVCRVMLEVWGALLNLCAAHSIFQPAAEAAALKKIPGFAVLKCIWGLCAALVGLLVHPSFSQPQQHGGFSAAGSSLRVLATSLLLMFSFTSMSGLFLPFKAWHLRGPSGYNLGNVGITRTFCTISFNKNKPKNLQWIL